MGTVSPKKLDTRFFGIHRPAMRNAIEKAFQYSNGAKAVVEEIQNGIHSHVKDFFNAEVPNPNRPFGWKIGMSIFILPAVLDIFPNARVIHLIRDGRDVMLSRLDARFNNLEDHVNKVAVFGDADKNTYRGSPLNKQIIAKYRNELEMLHWVTAVSYGLLGRNYPERYLEVRYEELCSSPLSTAEGVFDFIEVPFIKEAREWLEENVHTERIGKWKKLPMSELEGPMKIGGDLLSQLEYIS